MVKKWEVGDYAIVNSGEGLLGPCIVEQILDAEAGFVLVKKRTSSQTELKHISDLREPSSAEIRLLFMSLDERNQNPLKSIET